MNSAEMTPTFSPEDLFLRDSDRERLAMSYNVMVTRRQSLLMISDSDVLLEHYGRMLIRMLRETTGVEVEVFFPSSTDALIQRFNDILAPLSVEDAMATSGAVLPARVLVMHDAKAVQRQQVELLARLVNDFPGANVRLVMLVNTTNDLTVDLSSFGKRTSRWTIEQPNEGTAEAFIDKAALQGQASAARALIDRLGVFAVEPEPEPPTADFGDMELPEAADLPSPQKRRRRRLLVLLLVVLLFVLSALLVLGLYPKHRAAVMQMLWPEVSVQASVPSQPQPEPQPEPQVAPLAAPVEEPAPAAVSAAVDSAAVPTIVGPLPGILPPWADVRTDVQMSRELRNQSEREATEKFLPDPRRLWVDERFIVTEQVPPTPAQPPVVAAAPVEVKPPTEAKPPAEVKPSAEVKAPAPPKPAAKTLSPADRLGHDWVNSQPDRYWVLQYASVVSAEQAQAWVEAHPKLERLHIVAAVKPNGLTHHVVVYGAFKSREEAQGFATSADSPKEYWARSIKSLKGVLRAP